MKAKLFILTILISYAAQAQETPQVADLVPTAEKETDVDRGGFDISLLGGLSRHFYTLTSNTNQPGQVYGMSLSNLPGTVLGGEVAYAPSKTGTSYKFVYGKTTSDYTEIPKATLRSTSRVDETYRFYILTKRWGLEKNWSWMFGLRRDLRSYTTTLARVAQTTVTPLTSNVETGLSFGIKYQGPAFWSFKNDFTFETFVPVFIAESPSSGSEQYILNFEVVDYLVYPFSDSLEAAIGLGFMYDRASFGVTAGATERNLREVLDETYALWVPFKLTFKF